MFLSIVWLIFLKIPSHKIFFIFLKSLTKVVNNIFVLRILKSLTVLLFRIKINERYLNVPIFPGMYQLIQKRKMWLWWTWSWWQKNIMKCAENIYYLIPIIIEILSEMMSKFPFEFSPFFDIDKLAMRETSWKCTHTPHIFLWNTCFMSHKFCPKINVLSQKEDKEKCTW